MNMKESFYDAFDDLFGSRLFKPFLVYFGLIAGAFVLPDIFVFDDGSIIHLREIFLYGSIFWLIGFAMGVRK